MSPAFRFSLDRVLRVREQQENQARLALAAAQVEYRSQARRVRELEGSIAEHDEGLRGAKSLTQGELWLWMRYRERLQKDREEASSRLQALAKELSECRRTAVERAKERKGLEKLRMKRLLEYRKEQAAKEQRQFDEMANLRYSRQDL